jgi:hypothetical protein
MLNTSRDAREFDDCEEKVSLRLFPTPRARSLMSLMNFFEKLMEEKKSQARVLEARSLHNRANFLP